MGLYGSHERLARQNATSVSYNLNVASEVCFCQTNLITLRERVTRKIVAIKNPSKSAEDVFSSIKNYFREYAWERKGFKSITFDNGTEFSKHMKIAEYLFNAKTFFCEPYKSYQKGAIENANKQLREYFPRDFKIDRVSQSHIDEIVNQINSRPMRCLDYQTPLYQYIVNIYGRTD